MLHRTLLLVLLVRLPARPGEAEAGPVMISVNTTMANANGTLDVTAGFSINTGTTASPTTSFKTPGGQTFTGRIFNQANGPPIVVYDLTDLSIARRIDLSITGSNPIAFLTTNNMNINGILSANGQPPDGSTGGAAGAGEATGGSHQGRLCRSEGEYRPGHGGGEQHPSGRGRRRWLWRNRRRRNHRRSGGWQHSGWRRRSHVRPERSVGSLRWRRGRRCQRGFGSGRRRRRRRHHAIRRGRHEH